MEDQEADDEQLQKTLFLIELSFLFYFREGNRFAIQRCGEELI